MPPETLTWERRRLERPERPDTPRYNNNAYRSRTPSHSNGRPVPWRYHSAESGRDFTPYSPSRANDTCVRCEFSSPSRANDEGFRPFGYRMDLRYNRFNRESKSPFVHRDIRGETWENSISPSSPAKSHFGRDQRSLDERSSLGRKDYKGQPWERRQNDDRSSFGRRSMRGKSWENGPSMDSSGRPHNGHGPCSVDEKAHFEKKGLKRRFQENGVFSNRHSSPHISNDQRPRGVKESSSRKDFLREGSCEMVELPSSPTRSCEMGELPRSPNKFYSDSDKDTKVQSVENSVAPDQSGIHTGTCHGPVNDMVTFTSPTHSELARTQDKHSQDQCDKSGGSNDEASGQKFEKENSLRSIDWKPLKWTRSGSLSSRGSGFSYSGCSKSTDSAEQKNKMPPRNDTPVRSPSGDVAAWVTESAVSFEAGSRKKPRLGWGEGLAKFEKKKVEGPDDDSATKPGRPACIDEEPSYLTNLAGQKMPTVAEKSPRVAGFLECAFPLTPSSVACSSSPGVEDKASMRLTNLNYDISHSSHSPNLLLPECTERNQEREFCLETVELISVANLSTSLTGLFPLENPAITESSFTISTALNKLSMWRSEALKVLEETESQIESLESDMNELKSNCGAQPCADVAPSTVSQSSPQLVNSSASVEKTDEVKDHGNLENCHVCSSIGVGNSMAALCDQILRSNKETASKAYEAINKVPSNICASRTSSHSSYKDDLQIKEKLARKMQWRKMKERVNTLKYRALQHLWKEDLKLMSSRKSQPKSQKRLGVSMRGLHGNWQKHRSSLRYRLSNGAITSISKLLSDPLSKTSNVLKMPAMIPNEERNTSIFSSNNGLVEDPCAVEKERALINPWTKEEKEVFMDKLATLGKDFQKISSFINHKTTADCIEFYYKNHKSDCFVKLKRKPDVAEQEKPYSFNSYLVGTGKRSNRDKNAASLHVLGEASAIAANADHATKTRYKPDFATQRRPYSSNKYLLGSAKRANRDRNAALLNVLGETSKIAANADHATKTYLGPDIKQEKPCSFKKNLGCSGKRANCDRNAASLHVLGEASAIATNADQAIKTCWESNVIEASQTGGPVEMPVINRETKAADVLVGICDSVSFEATNACVTSSFDHGESYKELTDQRLGSDHDSCSDEMEFTNWTDEERSTFVQALVSYGNDFMMISRRVGTKSSDQCKLFFSKARKCLGLGSIRSRPCGEGEDDTNGGGTDNGGACFVEVDLVVSSKRASSKADRDVLLSDMEGGTALQPDIIEDRGKGEALSSAGSHETVVESNSNSIQEAISIRSRPCGEGEDDTNGGGTDNGGACFVEVDLVVSSKRASSKADRDVLLSDMEGGTALQPDIIEDRGKGEALSLAGSHETVVESNSNSIQEASLAKVRIVEEQQMVTENNADKTEVETGSSDLHEAHGNGNGNGLRDLNSVDLIVTNNLNEKGDENSLNGMQEAIRIDVGDLNVVDKDTGAMVIAPAVIAPAVDDPLEFGVNVRQEQRIILDLSHAVKESHGLSLGRDNYRENGGCVFSFEDESEYLIQKLHRKPANVGASQLMPGSLKFGGYPVQMPEVCFRRCSGSGTANAGTNGGLKLFGKNLNSRPERHIDSTVENVNQQHTENIPSRNHGLLDGNMTRIKNPYPAVLGSLPNSDQQNALQAVVNNSSLNLNGVSVIPSREMTGGNQVVNYQLYSSRQDLTSDLKRRKAVGAVSTLRNSTGVVRSNVGISDPVAAIKLHYANVENFSDVPMTNNIPNEDHGEARLI